MRRRRAAVLTRGGFAVAILLLAGCGPTRTLIVRFDELRALRSDLFVLEESLEPGTAATIEWNQAPDQSASSTTRRPPVPGTIG